MSKPRLARAVGGECLLSIDGVMAKTAMGKTLLLEMVREGTFPQPRRINARVVRWVSSDVDAWIRELPRDIKGAA